MTTVRIGNTHAIEGYRDEDSDDPDLVRYRELVGERVTTMVLPEGIDVQEAAATVIVTLGHHMQADAGPEWIECEDKRLHAILCGHYGVDPTKLAPPEWGANLMKPTKVPAKKTAAKKTAAAKKAATPPAEEGET